MKKSYVQLESGTILETENPEIWPEAKKLSVAKGKALMKAEAISELREMLKPGDVVWTCLRHVSKSGMSRRIEAFIIRDNEPRNISFKAAKAMDRSVEDDGIQMGGCGMDMGFALVSELAAVLFPDGADDANGKHEPGYYCLSHRWL